MNFKALSVGLVFYVCIFDGFAAPVKEQLLVWANEAIVATYTYSYKTSLDEQKNIARYFTTAGWINYNKALTAAKLPELIAKNTYEVGAVATKPPQLTSIDATHWTVMMPILVHYKNPQYQQQQNVQVTIDFTVASPGQGVRGFAVTRFQSVELNPPCLCSKETQVNTAPLTVSGI